MSWYDVKQRYGIEHIVHVKNGMIYVSSAYADLIIISKTGGVYGLKDNDGLDYFVKKYGDQILKDEKSGKLQELVNIPAFDSVYHHDNLLEVYKCKNGKLIKNWCFAYGYPNVTVDGELMFVNVFYKTKEEALKKGINEEKAYVKHKLLSSKNYFKKYRIEFLTALSRYFILFQLQIRYAYYKLTGK